MQVDQATVGSRVRYSGSYPLLQRAKGVIREGGSWACVEWDLEYRTLECYVNVSDLELELLTPEEQEKLADQKRREEHAMRYL